MVSSCNTNENPLNGNFNTPFNTIPFNKIKTEHYMPAFEQAIKDGETEIKQIVENNEKPTFENTVEALENSGDLLDRTSSIFFNMISSNTSSELQQLAQTVSPMITEYQNNIILNTDLFERVKNVYNKRENLNLNTEQAKLLDDTYQRFARNGANLSDTDKVKYREISEELSKLALEFGNNVLEETNLYKKHITDKNLVKGVPESALEIASEKAKKKSLEGYIFDITIPSYNAVMKYANNRELRKELFTEFMTKACKGNKYDNKDITKRIVELRIKKAQLLGYKNYADYVLVRRMAETPKNVYNLLDDLLDASMPVAKKEKQEVTEYAKTLGFNEEVMPWDWLYYSEKLKTKKFDLNDEMLKPYFKLENVIDGVFGLATDLYGITFKENKEIPVYHPDVKPFEVYNNDGSLLAILYTDFHPRESKRGGAWMNEFLGQYKRNGVDNRPHVTIVMNFTPSTETKPALLTFDEVETFLHEFGHALHGMFANSTYKSLSGTNVYRDFVELPSQIMENWAGEKEFLDKFAIHYQTGKKIPTKLIEKIHKAKNFNEGYASIRQLSFGFLDMAWHTLEKTYTGNVKEFEEKAWEKTQIFYEIEGIAMSTQFNHLFAGGYAAGYYGYKWAEVLDADAFSLFKKNGIYDKVTAESFRKNILEKGGREHPMILYKAFRGQEPTVEALKERSGFSMN